MAFLLPEDIAKLKCALCQKYLSVPPIMVISESGDDYKCGRCQDIKSQVNIRNKIFESLLKFAKFPCIYENCKEELSWGAVEEHEQICLRKTYRCNILENCSDVVPIDRLTGHHITKKHPYEKLRMEKFEIYIDGGYGANLLIKNKIPYLIYFEASRPNFWISVFSLKSKPTETMKFEVKLCTSSNIGLLLQNGTVIPYNEREHCARCLFMGCDLPYHKFSNVNNRDRAAARCFIREKGIALPYGLTMFFGHNGFNCTVNILDEPKTSKINKPEVVMKETKEPSSCGNNKLLRQILQCPICMVLMPAEIYTCKTGHVICNTCKPRLQTCPTCGKEFADSRNYALEEIAEDVELGCEHQAQGCNFIGNVVNICRHQAQCSYKSS